MAFNITMKNVRCVVSSPVGSAYVLFDTNDCSLPHQVLSLCKANLASSLSTIPRSYYVQENVHNAPAGYIQKLPFHKLGRNIFHEACEYVSVWDILQVQKARTSTASG